MPEMLRYLTKTDGETSTIRTPIALAAIRLLQHFPVSVLNDHVCDCCMLIDSHMTQLPRLVLKVLVVLRDKQFSTRETARHAIVQVL